MLLMICPIALYIIMELRSWHFKNVFYFDLVAMVMIQGISLAKASHHILPLKNSHKSDLIFSIIMVNWIPKYMYAFPVVC